MQNVTSRPTLIGSWSLPDWIGLGGAVAGFLAGAIMVLVSPLLSVITGISVWEPPKLIAATVMGPAAISEPGFVLMPVLVGTVLHFVVSIVLGLIFGVLMHRVLHLTTDFGLPVYVGLCYGLLIFFLAYFVVLPMANPMLIEAGAGMGPVIVQNIVFGMFLGIFYILVRPQPYTSVADE